MQKIQCCTAIITFSIFILLTAIYSATTLNRTHCCISMATISIFILLTEILKYSIYTTDKIWCQAVWIAKEVQAEWYTKFVILHNSTTEGTQWCNPMANFNIFISLTMQYVAQKQSKCAIIFPRQLWLHKYATILHYTYTANLVCDCTRYCRELNWDDIDLTLYVQPRHLQLYP
jgi:hypothetical protein